MAPATVSSGRKHPRAGVCGCGHTGTQAWFACVQACVHLCRCVYVCTRVCVCVCMCLWEGMSLHLCIYLHTCVYVYCMCICVHVWPHTCVWACAYMCLGACLSYACAYVCLCVLCVYEWFGVCREKVMCVRINFCTVPARASPNCVHVPEGEPPPRHLPRSP